MGEKRRGSDMISSRVGRWMTICYSPAPRHPVDRAMRKPRYAPVSPVFNIGFRILMRIPYMCQTISRVVCLLFVVIVITASGCTTDDWAQLRPVFLDRYFPEEIDPNTSAIRKPAERLTELRDLAETMQQKSPAEQQQIATALAQQIQREQDPLIRRGIVIALAKTQTPLATAVITAGLKDPERDVRIACCQAISERRVPGSAAQLTQVLERDNSVDVRLAAIRAIGVLNDASALGSLVPALESRDPAIQFAAMDAARAIRSTQGGPDLGNDVNAWIAYAQGQTSVPGPSPEGSSSESWAQRLIPGWN